MALSGIGPPTWTKSSCDRTTFVSRVVGFSLGSASVGIGPDGARLTARDGDGNVQWTEPVPMSDLARSAGGGILGLAGVLYEIDARGRALWQWPGGIGAGVVREPELEAFCNAHIASSGEGDLFIGTNACPSAKRLLTTAGAQDLEIPEDVGRTFIARIRPELLPEFRKECGNGWLDPGEDCDGDVVPGTTCESVTSIPWGEIRCGKDCKLDTSDCVDRCGDGVADDARGEQCDGQDVAGETCATYSGWRYGTLRCTPGTCQFDTSACSDTPSGG
jgi:hypothetical protein